MKRVNVSLLVMAILAAALLGWLAQRPNPSYTAPTVTKDGAYVVGAVPEGDSDALKACATAMATALTYDHRSLTEDLDRATALMTDRFGIRFRDTFDRTTRPDADQKKVATRSLVRAAGVTEVDEDEARCLVFLDQILLHSSEVAQKDKPVTIAQTRIKVWLALVDGRWLVDDIQPF